MSGPMDIDSETAGGQLPPCAHAQPINPDDACPFLVQAVRDNFSLPTIPSRDGPEKPHKASQSSHHVPLPLVWNSESKEWYLDESKEFMETHEFRELQGLRMWPRDPSSKFHRSEADASRTVDRDRIRPQCHVLQAGFNETDGQTLTMDGSAQTWTMVTFADRAPDEPTRIISIPDFTIKCVLTYDNGETEESNLIVELKFPGHLPTGQVRHELSGAFAKMMAYFNEHPAEVMESLLFPDEQLTSIPPEFHDVVSIAYHGVPGSEDWQARATSDFQVRSELGLADFTGFPTELEEMLHQGVTYGVVFGADRVVLTDYIATVILALVVNKHQSELERVRAGPGIFARALETDGSDQDKVTLGSHLLSIRGKKRPVYAHQIPMPQGTL